MTWEKRACPRCAGDLFVEEDIFSTDLVCLQCGFRRPKSTPAWPVGRSPSRRRTMAGRWLAH